MPKGLLNTTGRSNNFKDLSGFRFEKLLVTGFDSCRSKRNYWLCLCDCGSSRIISTGDLTSGHTKSCGCIRHESSKLSQSIINSILGSYKVNAKNRSLSWEISDDFFTLLISGDCFYCGIEPCQVRITKRRIKDGLFVYNGVDRVNNALGYLEKNVVSCCRVCNKAKDIMTQEEFLSWAKRVAQHSENSRQDIERISICC
jgi:hypothetical protein